MATTAGTETLEIESLDTDVPDEQMKNFSSSDADSSSSDEEEEDEAAQELRLETLEKVLSENPSDYDSHVQCIQCLRKLGRIEKLRQAREAMSALFPLSPNMWQEWAKDEASLRTGSEAFSEIEKIYERGVQEYISVSLWSDYLDFVEEHDPLVSQCTPVGLTKMRDLFERALTAAGLHIIEGNKIWEAFREFEQAILLTIEDANSEEKAKQIQRIRALFHRQLSVPLADLRSTLLAYKHWEAEQGGIDEIGSGELDGIPPNVASSYQKAMDAYTTRAPYEELISKGNVSNVERIQHFMTYIKFEESSGDPARVQVLYERAVVEFPISSELWLAYTSYLDRKLKVPNVVKSVYSRATRNCTWVADLWVRYLLALEHIHASEKELSSVFEQSLQFAFSTFEEYLDLFLTRIDGLRRRISFAGVADDTPDYAKIRDTFQHAADYLSPHLKGSDSLLRLHTYWARLEATLGNGIDAARGVWESFIKTSGSLVGVWQHYIAMEIEMNHVNEARSIYKRCYSKRFPGSGSEDICHAWLQFEREFGTLEDFDNAVRKVTPRLEELKVFRLQLESKSVVPITHHKENVSGKITSQKRKTATKPADEQPSSKKQKTKAPKETGARVGSTIETLGKANGAEDSDSLEAVTLSRTIDPGTGEQVADGSIPQQAEPHIYRDQCTAYVSNISLEANEDHLRDFFSDIGGVTAIRLMRDKFTGKSRGFAYVDFSDDEHLKAAISRNKHNLLGKKLSIMRSDPKQRQKKSSAERHGGEAHRTADHGDKQEKSRQPGKNSSESVRRRGGHVQLEGKNTFAMPRAVVKPLGWSNKDSKKEGEEKPKSNDEFREMLLKK
ncbi:Heterogeneous nuclear ribonucleoprotein 1 [Acorus gramineus]|uniref:Heterogeneous nuclear ribonucleoprotein 1 n=1 Tax=Acorus gramineus TaxID=55184 RepID=A0AAV9BER6_ACOGR|nr:Heterogeneous nuclear ribonucleoprotein 1 [Acorus gramineus]